MELRTAQALRVLGLLTDDRLPEVAVSALERGIDSPALRMLAGLVRREIAEASDLFAQAMKESGLEALSRPDAARVYAVAVSKQIISGEITPQYGATRLWEASIRVGDPNFHELDTFIYAASELQTRPEDKDFFNKEIMREAEAWTSKSDF